MKLLLFLPLAALLSGCMSSQIKSFGTMFEKLGTSVNGNPTNAIHLTLHYNAITGEATLDFGRNVPGFGIGMPFPFIQQQPAPAPAPQPMVLLPGNAAVTVQQDGTFQIRAKPQ